MLTKRQILGRRIFDWAGGTATGMLIGAMMMSVLFNDASVKKDKTNTELKKDSTEAQIKSNLPLQPEKK